MKMYAAASLSYACLAIGFLGTLVSHAETPETQTLAPVFNGTGTNTCTGAVVIQLPIGPPGNPSTVTITGNNSTATGPECVGGATNSTAWWEAFQLTQRARVTVDLCGTTPIQVPSYNFIQTGCGQTPCFQPKLSDSSGRGAPFCGDGNEWYTFDALNSGTYRVPILSDPNVLQNPRGPYVMHIHAEACPGSCCDFNSQMCDECVEAASCAGPGQVFHAGETCFRARCFDPPGPDVIVGNVWLCEHLGRVGAIGAGTVAMSCWTTACNQGNARGNWIALPNTDHPVIMVNMYRESTVAGSSRFEQIGQGWLKHGFGSANDNECGFGCEAGAGFSEIGIGCSDTYAACQFDPCGLAPRSMINPYTGVMPGGAALGTIAGCGPCANDNHSYPANDHRGHVHTPISHKVQVQEADLDPVANAGARYFAEGQYVAPHEYTTGNGNQNNNASHVEVAVGGPDGNGVYTYTSIGATVSESPAVEAWTGSSKSKIEPAPLADGVAYVAWQATDLGGGAWHYEYAVHNQNLDRGIVSICIPLASGVNVSNVGFHAPLNHAPEDHADTYPNTPWTPTVSASAMRWDTDSFATDPLANAVRFGTLYNFRFDADMPPQATTGVAGMFKIPGLQTVALQGPSPATVDDVNQNGIPDACEGAFPAALQADPSGADKTRYLSFTVPMSATASSESAIQVKLVSLMHPSPANLPLFPAPDFTAFENTFRYVGTPGDCQETELPPTTFKCASLQCAPVYLDWSAALGGALLHVSGKDAVPSSTYELRQLAVSCQGNEATCSAKSASLMVQTQRWGDIVAPYQAQGDVALTQPNIIDVGGAIDKFRGLPSAPIIAQSDVNPGLSDNKVQITDIGSIIDAFKGFAYPFKDSNGPQTCP